MPEIRLRRGVVNSGGTLRRHGTLQQGLGAYDETVGDGTREGHDELIAIQLRRMERARIELTTDCLGSVSARERILHGGRSAETVTSLRERFGCSVYEFDDSCAHFADGIFDVVVDDEIHLKKDLFAHCAEVGRLLRPRGRYVFTALCCNDGADPGTDDMNLLYRQVGVVAQPRARYFAALTSNGFVPYVVADLTAQVVPYWQLRTRSRHRTGIDRACLSAYLSQTACLLLVAAERFGGPGRNQPRRRREAVNQAMNSQSPTSSATDFGLAYH